MDSTLAGATGAVITLAGQKLLGKTLDEMGADFATLYKKGRNFIIEKSSKKVKDLNDGSRPNLRVARDVFWNGSFTDESICAEYFGGILASSRSADGKDDNGIHYADVIKSLSSKQLHLHYVIYNSLNKLLVKNKTKINVGLSTELHKNSIFFASNELTTIGLSIETDFNILYKQGLIFEYRTDIHTLENDLILSFSMAKPTTFGMLLYAISYNKFNEWRYFSEKDYGDFENIKKPLLYAQSLELLISQVKSTI